MKYITAVVVSALVMLFALPLYAANRDSEALSSQGEMTYAEKIRNNNKKIAAFVADTFKMPYVLLGDFAEQDHEKVISDTKYEGHEYLKEMPSKWHNEGKAAK